MSLLSKLFKKGPEPDPEVIAVLKEVPLFKGLGGGGIEKLERIVRRREFHEGDAIMRQGNAGHSMYIILSGTVAITEGPERRHLAELHEGECFGELSLLLEAPRTATATARTHTRTLVFYHNDLNKLAKDSPRLGGKIIERLSKLAEERNTK